MLACVEGLRCELARAMWWGWFWLSTNGKGGTNHLVFQNAIFIVHFGTLCTVASELEVVETFLGESFGAVVGAGEAQDTIWLGYG